MSSLLSAIGSAAIGVLIALILWGFYRKFEDDWPVNYQTVATPYDLMVRRNVSWHVVARVVPVFVASLLTAALALQAGLSSAIAVVAMTTAHLASTTAVAIWMASRRRFRRAAVIAYNVCLSAFLVTAAWLGCATAERASWLVPPVSEFRNAIWVAIAVVIMAKLVDAAAGRLHQRDVDLRVMAERDIGPSALSTIPLAARRHAANEALLRAIIYAEVLQRPRALRALERLKGRFVPSGSYGVGQVRADHPIDDEASIECLAATIAGSAQVLAPPNQDREDLLDAYIELHSRDLGLRAHVHDFYQQLLNADRPLDSSENIAPDGRPRLDLLRAVREGFTCRLIGTIWMDQSREHLSATVDDVPANIEVVDEGTGVGRVRWSADVPLTSTSVQLTRGRDELLGSPGEWLRAWW